MADSGMADRFSSLGASSPGLTLYWKVAPGDGQDEEKCVNMDHIRTQVRHQRNENELKSLDGPKQTTRNDQKRNSYTANGQR